MTPVAYYNEHDKYAAAWLRNLINAGLIAPGIVDERSIEDVKPNDLTGFTQCHFFAGIGVWSYSLRRAGWPDTRRIWTASCPCQPFSAAGAGVGFADERHLWPSLYHLVGECRPPEIIGEQVASSFVEPWIDLVHADMEAVGYTFGCVPFPSAGVGAPHIRDRLYWVADSNYTGLEGRPILPECRNQRPAKQGGLVDGVAYAADIGQHGRWSSLPCDGGNAPRVKSERLCDVSGLAYASSEGPSEQSRRRDEPTRFATADGASIPDQTNSYWANADWIGCTDGKWRPVEPGTSPLVTGAAARMGRLRAYGNALNAEAAVAFIHAIM